jgi:hypothetical protein
VKDAIDWYRHEFSTLLQPAPATTVDTTLTPPPQVLFLHQKLVTFLGQDIRFQLRTLFNPAPYNAVDKPDKDNHPNPQRSRVPELVQLYMSAPKAGKGKNNEQAHAEGVLSCIVSTALQCIYNYFGRDASLRLSQSHSMVDPTPVSFCQSAASQRGLVDALELNNKSSHSTNSTTTTTTYQEDWQAILQDIKHAFLFLGAARAGRFLLDLLRAEGVDQAIHDVGGWSTIERNAQLLCQYQSYCCPEDEHLVLLANVHVLVQALERCFDKADAKMVQCQQALHDLYRRFKCGDKGRIRKRFPHIAILANTYEEMTCLSQFPLVR